MREQELQTMRGSGIDPIDQYLREIGQYPMLTKDDEYRLGERIVIGRDAEEKLEADDEHVKAIENLGEIGVRYSEGYRAELQEATSEADEARKTFVTSNLRLVVSIAKRYQYSGEPLLDLIQEGNGGLIHAVELFDHKKGFKFSTYATWWIRQAIGRGVADKGQAIRLPSQAHEDIGQYGRAVSQLEQEGVHAPDELVLAERMGKTPEQIIKIRENKERFRAMVSLDAPKGDEGDFTLQDRVIKDEPLQIDAATDDLLNKELVQDIFEKAGLTEKEKAVLRLRFEQGHTLEETGQQFGVTRERARQIEGKALGKARSYLRAKAVSIEDIVA
jgi:RNA polymerase primary sigma factor